MLDLAAVVLKKKKKPKPVPKTANAQKPTVNVTKLMALVASQPTRSKRLAFLLESGPTGRFFYVCF